jgi:hypothetical protein
MPAARKLPRLSAEQFSALSEILRLRESKAAQAARLVLVDGLPRPEAAAQADASPQIVFDALARCARGIELAEKICKKSKKTS